MDRSASKVVGLGYIDRDVNGSCGGGYDEIVPFIWDSTGGMREFAARSRPTLDAGEHGIRQWPRGAGSFQLPERMGLGG